MKSIDSSVRELHYSYTESDMWRMIEYAARICYNSTDKMVGGGDSKKWVCKTIIPSGHGRALEFGSVYLKIPFWRIITILKYAINPYTRVNRWNCVTTNYRVLHDNGWEDNLKWWGFTKHHAVRRVLQWTISRVQADSFRTHCSISSLMQSTRYVLFSKLRNGGEIVYIKPTWYNTCSEKARAILNKGWEDDEKHYMALAAEGMAAQFAREVLPLSIKTEFVQCAFEDDWKAFFALRADDTEHNVPHPDAKYVAKKARKIIFGI